MNKQMISRYLLLKCAIFLRKAGDAVPTKVTDDYEKIKKKIEESAKSNSKPFFSWFNGSDRVYIPFKYEYYSEDAWNNDDETIKITNNIVKFLTSIGYTNIDIKNGFATKGKRKEKIGKIFSRIASPLDGTAEDLAKEKLFYSVLLWFLNGGNPNKPESKKIFDVMVGASKLLYVKMIVEKLLYLPTTSIAVLLEKQNNPYVALLKNIVNSGIKNDLVNEMVKNLREFSESANKIDVAKKIKNNLQYFYDEYCDNPIISDSKKFDAEKELKNSNVQDPVGIMFSKIETMNASSFSNPAEAYKYIIQSVVDSIYDHGFNKQTIDEKLYECNLRISGFNHSTEYEEIKDLYDEWQRLAPRTERSVDKKDLFVVISQDPQDVAMMSTGRGWTSCMNLSGGTKKENVYCEVESGGIIAYLIHKDDVDIKNPIARILIRRFADKKGHSFAIPEERVYGEQSVKDPFLRAVKAWLNEKQGDELADGRYFMEGSRYSDTLPKFIDNPNPSGNKRRNFYSKKTDPIIEKKIKALLKSPTALPSWCIQYIIENNDSFSIDDLDRVEKELTINNKKTNEVL